jgi:hypothetical protein
MTKKRKKKNLTSGCLDQRVAKFFLKGQIGNILALSDHTASVKPTQLHPCHKHATTNYVNEQMWQCFCKFYL